MRLKQAKTNMDELKATIQKSTPLTPLTFLERAAIVYGDCPSIIYNTTTYTWSDTNRRCLQAASAISSLGIRTSDVVSVVSSNVPAAYELHFAVPMTGAILNNINTRLNATTISALLRHSQSKLVFVYHQFASLVLEAISIFPPHHPKPILVLISEDENDNKKEQCLPVSSCSPTNVRNNDIILPSDQFRDTYENLIKKGNPKFKWLSPASEWDPIALNYTSGTTSSPKGVVHCHRGSYMSALNSLIDWSMPKQPVYLWILPMFHANGWTFPWAMAAVGATNICLSHFDGGIIYRLIHQHKVTHMCGAPVVLKMLVTHHSTIQTKLNNPVHFFVGGSPPPVPIILQAEALGFVIVHGYGLTETGGVVVSCAWKREWNEVSEVEKAKLKSRQGVRTLGMTAVDVVDPTTNKPVARDGKTMGEIMMRGSTTMLGYLKNPKDTSKCMDKDGWFRTGDLGVMHKDGYIEIKDRSKDVIISGGENISSVEVESVLYTYPGVNEVAVVAQPHEFWGETPCAFVCFNKDVVVKPTEKEVIEFCREKMAHYMVPKRVIFKDELPKTSTGKIQKVVLREMARDMVKGVKQTSRL